MECLKLKGDRGILLYELLLLLLFFCVGGNRGGRLTGSLCLQIRRPSDDEERAPMTNEELGRLGEGTAGRGHAWPLNVGDLGEFEALWHDLFVANT